MEEKSPPIRGKKSTQTVHAAMQETAESESSSLPWGISWDHPPSFLYRERSGREGSYKPLRMLNT